MIDQQRTADVSRLRTRWAGGLVAAALCLQSTGLWAADIDANACLMCHEGAELSGIDAATTLEVLKKPSPRVHRRFAKLTEEEVAALLAVFAPEEAEAPPE